MARKRIQNPGATSKRTRDLLVELSETLNGLPDVFSTPQWGGRAYKLPGAGGRQDRPKLLAHVGCDEDGAVTISFKLPPERAKTLIRDNVWIEPHSFRTLAPSGWLTARLTTKRQLATLRRLIRESRELYGSANHDIPPSRRRGSDPAAARIDQLMKDLRQEGYEPGGGEF